MICRVTRGEIGKEEAIALEMALDDLRTYWEKAFGAGSFLLEAEEPGRPADLELLIGTAENLPRVAALVAEGRLENTLPPEQGFALDVFESGGKRSVVLRAADRLGLQYAVYGFAEQFLGVRFVHPLLDLQPETPPFPEDLHLVEAPSCAFRVLYETSHVRAGLRGTLRKASHFSDVGAWRWEDWAGNPERMRHLVAWAVKNRANIVMFEDTLYDEVKYARPFVVSDALWQCMDARGLKTLSACSTAYVWSAEGQARYGKDDYCNHDAPRVGPWDKHLCVGKPTYWSDLDEWLDVLAPHAHRLAGVFSNWQENVCGEGVTEGHEDGVIHRSSPSPYDMNCARFREPVLSHGGGCPTCGHLANVDKWVKVSDYLRGPQGVAAHGLPPAGITRTFWGMAEPDDGMVAERVVPHLPAGSVSFVACLPSSNRAERVEAWPRLMDEANRADNGNRRVVLMRELFYGCQSDMPIVPFSNLDRLDDDFRVFGKYGATATTFGGVYVYHSMGWLLALYSMRKQWQADQDWKSWCRCYFAGLLGGAFTDRLLGIATRLQEVQLLEGLEPGELPSGYYTFWGLDLARLASGLLPAEGPLRAVWRDGRRFLRLVQAGAADTNGIYTSERCTPVLSRVLSMRAKLEQALNDLPALAKSLPAGLDGPQWNELVLLPLRVTTRFLQSRLLLAASYLTYIRLRERVLQGLDGSADAREGVALCRQAYEAQDEYIRLRPGFATDYPMEVGPGTLRTLIGWWRRLAREPELARDLDICAYLDRVETEAAQS
jgi:hypothetical protein